MKTVDELYSNLSDEQKRFMFRLITDYKKQYLSIRKQGHRGLTKAVKASYLAADRLIKYHFDNELNTHVCGSGCSYCCYVYVSVTKDEAQYIVNYCRNNKIEIDAEKLKKQKDFNNDTWPKNNGDIAKCIFLNEAGKCSIYPVRPITCRKYYVASKPHNCNKDLGVGDVEICNIFHADFLQVGIMDAVTFGGLPALILDSLS